MKTKLLIEQHFHGCYGINFNTATVDDVLELSYNIRKEGIGGIFPTLVTDSIENIRKQVSIIKAASERQKNDCAKILGVHLEGIFLNPAKKGIHNSDFFLDCTINNYKKLDDDFIKIVTLAPELCANHKESLISFLAKKSIKVQAGHCIGGNLESCSGVTHTYNAMEGINHRTTSTLLTALIDDSLYTEIIADGVHVNNEALKLLFKVKPLDKIILISDCLPCTRSNLKEFQFAGKTIYYNGVTATAKDGIIAGSTKLLPDIIKILVKENLFSPKLIENSYRYHNVDINGSIEWDEDYNIVKVK